MIKLRTGHRLEFLAASGTLGFEGNGYFPERVLARFGLFDPHLFTPVTKTLFLYPWKGNFRRYAPWQTIKFLSAQGRAIHPLLARIRPSLVKGVANAVGLTGPGFEFWYRKHYPTIQILDYRVIVSITGEAEECVEMVKTLNYLMNIAGIEFNASCPNIEPELLKNPQKVVDICLAIAKDSRLPVILKLGYTQDYCQIAKKTEGMVGAISINSVPWAIVYPDRKSPLAKYGGGGVSGQLAQPFTWQMVKDLVGCTNTPVIGPSIWEYEDIQRLKTLGASAYHFGAIFLPYPWKPPTYIKKWKFEQKRGR